jgi:hypothetical protein
MSELYVSWLKYHEKIEILAAKIYQSDWEFDAIVCLAKGGLRVGDILCRIYNRPLAIMFTSSYGGKDNRERGEVKIAEHLAMTVNNLGERILLVDDLVDSGKTALASISWLKERYPIKEIRTAVIWYKSCSAIAPDYYVDYLANNPWIHQPFEIYELTNPQHWLDKHLHTIDF